MRQSELTGPVRSRGAGQQRDLEHILVSRRAVAGTSRRLRTGVPASHEVRTAGPFKRFFYFIFSLRFPMLLLFFCLLFKFHRRTRGPPYGHEVSIEFQLKH